MHKCGTFELQKIGKMGQAAGHCVQAYVLILNLDIVDIYCSSIGVYYIHLISLIFQFLHAVFPNIWFE